MVSRFPTTTSVHIGRPNGLSGVGSRRYSKMFGQAILCSVTGFFEPPAGQPVVRTTSNALAPNLTWHGRVGVPLGSSRQTSGRIGSIALGSVLIG
jgi:hypothetical protein